ncbi:PEBP family protein [Yoonia maritima]|uniref:PEBP family protein n=1 Tax=Yoonia maritima TaxID=1435347 RepID=UPI003735B7D2
MRLMTIILISALVQTSSLYAETYDVDVWADNWFEMRVNGEQVAEDSVPITTERSFNAESFSFNAERPFVIGLIAKDFKENDTGLEYIGTGRQQMGDGGVILQIRDASSETILVSDDSWQCAVIHTAPLSKSCESEGNPIAGEAPCGFEASEEPEGWDLSSFDASGWAQADVYTAAQVSPKFGYDEISWDENAQLIWGPDLEQSNTVLCRITVE